jgi:hypothetical protein
MRMEMKGLGIKVEEPFLDNVEYWQYDYFVRGYKGIKRYWDAALKLHGTKLLDVYFHNIKHKLNYKKFTLFL